MIERYKMDPDILTCVNMSSVMILKDTPWRSNSFSGSGSRDMVSTDPQYCTFFGNENEVVLLYVVSEQDTVAVGLTSKIAFHPASSYLLRV